MQSIRFSYKQAIFTVCFNSALEDDIVSPSPFSFFGYQEGENGQKRRLKYDSPRRISLNTGHLHIHRKKRRARMSLWRAVSRPNAGPKCSCQVASARNEDEEDVESFCDYRARRLLFWFSDARYVQSYSRFWATIRSELCKYAPEGCYRWRHVCNVSGDFKSWHVHKGVLQKI